MNQTIFFKPIVWRLAIWTFTIYYLLSVALKFVYEKVINHYPGNSFLSPALALGFMVGTILARKLLVIEISEGKVSGPSGEFFKGRTTFQIKELDRASVNKQSLYEKISGFHSVRSVNGEKIIFTSFIYGKSKLDEFHKTLIQE
ncbi:MAG: hypothetical protein KJZ72_13940 [Anaerolineales bacterium]|jgi:hypothetical protein|nr:hypothetical protein [Anaerolineales bacterium]